MKSSLSGMPECKVCFNDKISGEAAQTAGVIRSGSSIDVDDMVFHQCVKLTTFANDRAISFIPPDGEFELMHYRKTEQIFPPFTITPMVRDTAQNRLEIRVNVLANYDAKLSANPLILKVPLPANAAEVAVTCSSGRGKYIPEQNSVLWKVTGFAGKSSADIVVDVQCLAATSKASPATKITDPISAEFSIMMYSASGMQLQYLKISEKSGYIPQKWLRYITKGGKYEVRMV